MSDVLAGFGTVVSATLGGVISSGLITYTLGARRAEKELLRTKLEKLYIEISRDIRKAHILAHSCCKRVLQLEKEENKHEVFEGLADDAPADESPSSDVYNTIINIYFPSSTDAYRNFWSKFQEINSFSIGIVIDSISKPVPKGSYEQIMNKIPELNAYATQLHAALLFEADKLNCPLWKRIFLRRRADPGV